MPSHQRYCCVCKNFGGKIVDDKKVSMHRFPVDSRVRKLWIQRCKNARPNFVFVNSDQTRLCGVHFVGRSGPTKGNPIPCYFPKADGTEKVYKISTLESDVTDEPSAENEDSNAESEMVSDIRSPDLSFEEVGIPINCNESILDISLKLHDYGIHKPTPSKIRHQYVQTIPEMRTISTQTIETRMQCTTSTQTQTVELVSSGCQVRRPSFTFEDIANSKSKVLFYTGLPDVGTFKCLFDELEGGMKEKNTGRPKSMRLIDEFFMVLMRLRLGLLLEDLATRFHISVGTCSTVFNRWVNYLDVNLSFLVKWPTRENINNTMPQRFSRKYPKCRVIIDCTEIRTETPCSLQLKSMLYSDYKSHMTWKSLIGISPSGIVTFVSDLYPGSISDKQITRKSGLVDLCEEGDAIMVDKGFLISDLTTPRGVDLIIPPFKTKKRQFLPHEVEATKSIANLRIHVEREMERIKNFRILQGTMPITMSNQATKIWKICVRLTNLLPPLVLDTKG